MIKYRMVCAFVLVAVLAGAAQAVYFQQGINGYTGCEDTWINEAWAGAYSAGGDDEARAGGVPWATSGDLNQAFVQFNDIFGDGPNQFPATSLIQSATLKLYVKKTLNSAGVGVGYIQWWPMMTDWAEGDAPSFALGFEGASCANWRYTRTSGSYTTSDYWGTGGIITKGPVKGVDYDVDGANETRSKSYMGAGGTYVYLMEFDVSNTVRAWQAGTYDNNGFYGYSQGSWDYIQFYTSECSVIGYRPSLEIIEAPSIPVPADTAFFKQGYEVVDGQAVYDSAEGYAGCYDTYLDGRWGYGGQYVGPFLNNYGGSSTMQFSGVPYAGNERAAGLIRFEGIFGIAPGQVDPEAEILHATLRIYPTAAYSTSDPGYMRLWPMETPWVEGDGVGTLQVGTSTYSYRQYRTDGNYAGHPESTWGSDGLEHQGPVQWTAATDPNVPDVDVPEHPSYMFKAYYSPDPCSASFRIANMWWDIDITGIVEAWRTESIPNWGLYGFGNGYYSHVRFPSSESMDVPHRPELIVSYKPVECGHKIVPYPEADISGPVGIRDCYVDDYDVMAMADQWLRCTMPFAPTEADNGCELLDEVHTIPHGTVDVNGSLDEWDNALWLDLDQDYYGENGEANDVLEAKFALQWNATTGKVYAAVKVRDMCQVLADSPYNWNTNDHIEVYMQGDPNGGTGWGADDGVIGRRYDKAQQYLIGPGSSEGVSWAYWPSGYSVTATPYDSPELEAESVLDGEWYTCEIGVKAFDWFGGFTDDTTVESNLVTGGFVGFDIIADTRFATLDAYGWPAGPDPVYGDGFGMLSENMMTGKYNDADQFQIYQLLDDDCGRWGFFGGDLDQNCQVDLLDFADMSGQWLDCTDPLDMDCDQSWRP